MGKSLVVVESPAKAKTINRYLGKDFVVRASMGHVRDLPKDKLGVDVDNNFEPTYIMLQTRRKVVTELKKLSGDADYIYLATDLDREGEAIAWHLVEALKIPKDRVRRVTFNEITKKAILKAFSEYGELSMDKFNAQQARRILDRVVGYQLSPLLWAKFRRGLSAGRVQSVATRLVVDKEREIENFKPEEYWLLKCLVHPEKQEKSKFKISLKERDGKAWKPKSEEETLEAVKSIQSAALEVKEYEEKKFDHYSPPPFTTSALQQSASFALKFSAKKTMQIAQQLYEGVDLGDEGRRGLISYHRTDSVRVSWAAVGMVRDHIKQKYGENYLPPKGRMHRMKAGAQAAHEAIRPTGMRYEPDEIKQHLSSDQHKIYKLIWNRFVASQMVPAVYSERAVEVAAGKYILEGKSRTLDFDGHSRVSGFLKDVLEPVLPDMKQGDKLLLDDIEKEQKFTRPPLRYTEGTLVKALESEGIGRPSTYATIISTILGRKYVEKRRDSLFATEVGKVVTDKLVEFFPKIMDLKFTSAIEEKLDQVEESKVDWHEVLSTFYGPFSEHLVRAEKEMNANGAGGETGEVCDKCGLPMVIKFKGKDAFLGCSGYPECKNSRPLGGPREKKEVVETELKCSKCGSNMLIREGRYGKFLACSAFPKCRNTMHMSALEGGDEDSPATPGKASGKKASKAEPSGETCEKCGSEMVWRKSRWGKFLACSGYPKCRNTRKTGEEKGEKKEKKEKKTKSKSSKPKKSESKPSGETCEKCGKEMVWKKGRWGPFLACSGYPDCKNIRKGSKK